MLAKLAALAVFEARARLVEPVLAEYRKLAAPPTCGRPHVGDQTYDISGTLAAQVERAPSWEPDTRPEHSVTSRRNFGFGR